MDESDGAESESTPSTIGSVTRGGLTFFGVAAVVIVAQTSAHTKINNATGFRIIFIVSQGYAHNDRTPFPCACEKQQQKFEERTLTN